jgi:hypothetical protein
MRIALNLTDGMIQVKYDDELKTNTTLELMASFRGPGPDTREPNGIYICDTGTCIFTDSRTVFGYMVDNAISLPHALSNASKSNKAVLLLDNGEVHVYDDVDLNRLIYISNTNDNSVQSNSQLERKHYQQVDLQEEYTTSQNGLYAIQRSQDDYSLLENVINSRTMQLYCAQDPVLQTNCYDSYANSYCKNNGVNDSRCICFNPEEILTRLFDVKQLKRSPEQYQQLIRIAPCLWPECRKLALDPDIGITNHYAANVVDCDQPISICSNVVNVTGSLSAKIVTVNCGQDDQPIPCSEGCPMGLTCHPETQICQPTCQIDSDCGPDQSCSKGVCGKRSNRWQTIAIIGGGVIFTIILIIGSIIIHKYRKKKQ